MTETELFFIKTIANELLLKAESSSDEYFLLQVLRLVDEGYNKRRKKCQKEHRNETGQGRDEEQIKGGVDVKHQKR